MSGSWMAFSTSASAPTRPLHAGITRDLIDNNLDSMAQESFYDLTSYPFSDAAGWSCGTSSGWQWFSTLWPIDVIVRPKQGGGTRDYTVHVDARLSTAKATHVRAYLHPDGRHASPSLDPSGGVLGYLGYATMGFSTSSYVASSCTISGANIDARQVTAAAVYPSGVTDPRPMLWSAFLRFAVSTQTPNTLRIMNVRISEDPD